MSRYNRKRYENLVEIFTKKIPKKLNETDDLEVRVYIDYVVNRYLTRSDFSERSMMVSFLNKVVEVVENQQK